jgi:hypothetical protein
VAGSIPALATKHHRSSVSLLVCDTWEMADALNRRLHDTLTTNGSIAQAARGQEVRVGDRRVLDRHGQRLASRQDAWHEHAAAARDFRAAYERMAAAVPTADVGRHVDGIEL